MNKQGNGIFTGRFTAHAQPDFQGTLDGGASIVFEAKYTTTDRLNRNVLTATQMLMLREHAELGAASYVCAGIGTDFFFVPWVEWHNMKLTFGRLYVTAEDLEAFQVRFNGAVLFLDYLNGKNVEGSWRG